MDQSYFDRVYETTYRPLLKYAIVHLSDPTDAEDALQNIYLAFYRRIERYGHLDVLFPKAFLLTMLKREVVQRRLRGLAVQQRQVQCFMVESRFLHALYLPESESASSAVRNCRMAFRPRNRRLLTASAPMPSSLAISEMVSSYP